MNTRTQTLPLWASSKTEPANPRGWRSHHKRLTVDGNVAYHWMHNAVKSQNIRSHGELNPGPHRGSCNFGLSVCPIPGMPKQCPQINQRPNFLCTANFSWGYLVSRPYNFSSLEKHPYYSWNWKFTLANLHLPDPCPSLRMPCTWAHLQVICGHDLLVLPLSTSG